MDLSTVFLGNACMVQKGNCTFVTRFSTKPLTMLKLGAFYFYALWKAMEKSYYISRTTK